MAENVQESRVGLPSGLHAQFRVLRRRLWRVETRTALSYTLSCVIASCLALFISDRIWNTPVWLRVLLLTVGLGGAAWFGLVWFRRWILAPRDQRDLAVLVQGRYRRLGDRLLGIVELADEKRRPAHFSPALYRAAIAQVARDAGQYDFRAAVVEQPARRGTRLLITLAALALVPALFVPQATLNAVQRWSFPAAAIRRYTLVRIEGLPAQQIVAHGEPFTIQCSVRYLSFWRPRRAACQILGQPRWNTAPAGDTIVVQVPAQTRPGQLRIALGDARTDVAIQPIYRPSLKGLTAVVQLPEYLQYSVDRTSAEGGSVTVVEGSRAAFEGKANRPLQNAELRVGDQSPQTLRIQEDGFMTDTYPLEGVSEVSFRWKDQLGLESAGPWRVQIRSEKDSPPTPEITELTKDTAILESEVLELRTTGRDDFGVKEIGVNWQLLTDSGSNNVAPRTLQFQAPSPREKKLEETFHFSPSLLMVPPDSVVELKAYATDYYPDREPTETTVYRIHVVGNERHAELIRQSLESLLSRLEEVTRLEEKVAANTRELQQLSKQKLAADETSEKIAAAKEDQTQNAASLDQMAREGKKTLREAFRNPTFTEDTLRDWAKNLQAMQDLAEHRMQEAAQALKSAQQDAESRPDQLAQASQKEQDILNALEKMQRNVNKGLDQLQAQTLAQRLRKIASDEKGISTRLTKIVPEVIGMFPKELANPFREAETTLASDQGTAQTDTDVLHGEIGRFFERTQKDNYGRVNKEMSEAHVTDELDHVRGLITENISMDAIQTLGKWADQLNAWADILQPKSDASGGSSSGGEGSSSDEALLKVLLGLLRVRDQEINLRQRTDLLEKQKPEAHVYEESASTLAKTQTQVREQASKVQEQNPVPALEFPLQDIVDSMQGVEELLAKPQTDRATDLAETKAIQQLSDVINLINEQQQQQQQSSSSPSPSAEEMAFLLQMMQQSSRAGGMSTNPKGGGSTAGGTTDRAATPALGDPNAKAGDARSVNRAGGRTVNAPTEFREALERYFKGLEALDRKP